MSCATEPNVLGTNLKRDQRANRRFDFGRQLTTDGLGLRANLASNQRPVRLRAVGQSAAGVLCNKPCLLR